MKIKIHLGVAIFFITLCLFGFEAYIPAVAADLPQTDSIGNSMADTAAAELPEGKKIVEVSLSGLKNVPLKTVWEVTKTRKGQSYKQEVVDNDLRAMFDLNLFSSINVDVNDKEGGVQVVFVVVEKKIIKQIDFKGNKFFKASALKDEITLKEKEAVDEGKLNESAQKIVTKYKEKGYAEAKVETYVTDLDEGKQVLTFFITEGKRVKIADVEVSGNKFLKAKKIQSVMKVRKGKYYKEETLTKGIENLEKYYRKRGFYNFNMEEPQAVYNDDHSLMTVKVVLSEGLRYRIGKITFTGNSILTEKDFRKDLSIKEGRIFDQEDFDQATANIQALYADKGHVFARIKPEVTTHDDLQVMDVDYQIMEGPMAYVGKVEIAGNEITKDYVIQREILLNQGDPLSMNRVRRSQERLYNLGFFEDVGLDTRPNQEKPEEQLDLIFNLKEKSQVNVLSVGLGYSTVDKVVGNMQLQINNLLGRGQKLNLMYEIGSTRQNYEVSFYEPWFFRSLYSFGANVFDTRREKTYYWTQTVDEDGQEIPEDQQPTNVDYYTETRKGGGISFGRRFQEIYNASVGYSYEGITIRNLTEREKISEAMRQEVDRGTVETSMVSLSLSRDTRDNVFDTTTGSRHVISYSVAGGALSGDNDFQKATLETSWFFPSFWKFVWGLRGMFGVVNKYGDSTTVPVYERFYLGGAETVRGYEYRGEIGEISGGKFVSLFNLEYSFPIIREKRQTILRGAFFYDAGNTWSTTKLGHYDYALKQGVGFSLRFTLPMFPIRFDWGYGLDHRENEANSQFYFSIGPVF